MLFFTQLFHKNCGQKKLKNLHLFLFILISSIFLFSCAPPSERMAKRGLELENMGRLEEAEKKFAKALKTDPNEPRAHIGLGYIYYKKGMYDKAIEHYKKGLEGNPHISKAYPLSHYYLGLAYNKKDMTEKARNEFSTYRKLRRIEY